MNPLHPKYLALLVAFLCVAAAAVPGQRRDFLTENEIEIVRDAQDIDARVVALSRMIDRRFFVLGINVNGWKDAGKASDTWGALPEGTRVQLFNDIKKILQKAVDDIDNLAANPNAAPIRDKGDKRAKKDPGRFAVAVRELGTAANRYRPVLADEVERSKDEVERGAMIYTIELCDQIIEAVGKLPPEPTKTKN
ncbi:MAG: hypothetical protein AB7Q37_06845 [Pyrinomonadaceae bacterium]